MDGSGERRGNALHAEGGTGVPIVLLHGLMGSAETWRPHVDWFRGYGRVFTWDAPGHGRAAPAEITTEAFVAELAEATQNIAEPMVLVGHSMGGLHGWVFAAQYPERVAGLVVEDMAPDFTGRSAAQWQDLVQAWPQPFPTDTAVCEYFGAVVGRYFLASFARGPQGYRLHGSVATFRAIADEWGSRDFWGHWRRVRAPALLVEAEHTITPHGQMRAMARMHPGAEHAVIAGAGHLVHDEAPDRYRAVVGPFLARVGRFAALTS